MPRTAPEISVLPRQRTILEKPGRSSTQTHGLVDGHWLRRNALWRRQVHDRQTGVHLHDQHLKANRARVLYVPTATTTTTSPAEQT